MRIWPREKSSSTEYAKAKEYVNLGLGVQPTIRDW